MYVWLNVSKCFINSILAHDTRTHCTNTMHYVTLCGWYIQKLCHFGWIVHHSKVQAFSVLIILTYHAIPSLKQPVFMHVQDRRFFLSCCVLLSVVSNGRFVNKHILAFGEHKTLSYMSHGFPFPGWQLKPGPTKMNTPLNIMWIWKSYGSLCFWKALYCV